MKEAAATQTLLLRGEVIEVSQRAGRRCLTLALEPHTLVAAAGVPEDTHLGDHVRVEAEVVACLFERRRDAGDDGR